ncbi:arylsulfatase A-like enzyme [Anseongella ginsenosidimutans]|uniref:Arylsulfatase A-like enzyme n=1 Tax=Anseongella ginsenosidimutans TaxID=496056 RepID=A0A4R3KW14_9SPHI|nr:sulfatase-like hydrolase/transferase [Anseongella ginsenosidimutans]TCS88906.1 arylsulfatase A-like enzyme [Anseongella ginsenosidimutans]
MNQLINLLALTALLSGCGTANKNKEDSPVSAERPNVVLIYADDLGYGDLGCYGAGHLTTHHIDALAAEGMRFTRAHASSATCTPSRYSLLTGEYAWRRPGRGIAPGDAALLIDTGITTLPSVFQEAGYATGVVGKWHLGLGPEGGPDWNGEIRPGPLEIGFNYSFLIPATGDRVPCVFVENHRVVGLEEGDPIQVNYKKKVGDWPTGKEHPELLKVHPSHGHNQTIVNGISRIGYMTGGKAALWTDENIADTLVKRAKEFISRNQDKPFFLFFSTHDIHVPRVPHERFAGKSGLGPRGDVILQLDWAVGELMQQLDRLGLAENTIVILTSDNGPVVDDGYQDQAVELLSTHQPSGWLRGGKYSAFEAGTRVPFIVRWPGKVNRGVSDALFSQVDLLESFAGLTGVKTDSLDAPDSFNMLDALLGKTKDGRPHVVEQAANGALSLVKGDWKYIEPHKGVKVMQKVNIETGAATEPQLYNLEEDPGEKENLAANHPEKVKELASLLQSVRAGENSR